MERTEILGRTVRLPDGRPARVVAEYWSWRGGPDNELMHGHRLYVRSMQPTCGSCPHGNAPVERSLTVDAADVAI